VGGSFRLIGHVTPSLPPRPHRRSVLNKKSLDRSPLARSNRFARSLARSPSFARIVDRSSALARIVLLARSAARSLESPRSFAVARVSRRHSSMLAGATGRWATGSWGTRGRRRANKRSQCVKPMFKFKAVLRFRVVHRRAGLCFSRLRLVRAIR